MPKTQNQPNNSPQRALQIAKEHQLPKECKSLNNKQMLFLEEYVKTLNIGESCKKAGYTQTYGGQLLTDVRCQLYINHLRRIYDAVSNISKGQIVEKLGQRVLSNDVKDNDLASLARELRYLQGFGTTDINTQINITLPDTYSKFFAKDSIKPKEHEETKKDKGTDVEIIEEW